MSNFLKKFGEYPPEYNREIHGPYNPSVYYGKRDTPFGDVKLGELGKWFSRRNKSLYAICQAISRRWMKYEMDWVQPKKPGPYFFYHFAGVTAFTFWAMDYGKFKKERIYRYH